MKAPIAVALDAPDAQVAIEWAKAVEPYLSTAKIGLELFVHYGPSIVEQIKVAAPSLEIFLDLKLHDIPNTVAGAAQAVKQLQPSILTVHASGGRAMVSAAATALPAVDIAAVTILTSLTDEDLREMKINTGAALQALDLAELSVTAGARAIVCSPQEVAAMRKRVGSAIRLITPGVRPSGSALDDQSRVSTPQQALADGADLLVVGRPITSAYREGGVEGVAAAACAIAASIR